MEDKKMKVHLNEKQKNWNIANCIKTGGLMVLLLAAMVFFSGCVGQVNTKSAAPASPPPLVTKTPPPPLNVPGYVTPTAIIPKTVTTPAPKAKTTTNPQTTTAAPVSSAPTGLEELLIKQPDVPLGFSLSDHNFYAADMKTGRPTTYKDSLPAGMRNFGQDSTWVGSAETQSIIVKAMNYDSGDWGLIPSMIEGCKANDDKTICGSANIGSVSYYKDMPADVKSSVWKTGILYSKDGRYYITITVTIGSREASHTEAFRIANLVLGRLK